MVDARGATVECGATRECTGVAVLPAHEKVSLPYRLIAIIIEVSDVVELKIE